MTCCPHNLTQVTNGTPLESLLRHIMPVVPEIPHEMALDRIRQAYIEFARRSMLIVDRLVIDYQANVHDYFLVPPDGYEVYQVMGLESPGYRYVDYWQGYNWGLWNTRFDVIDNRKIYLHTAPSVDAVDGLIIYAQLLPSNCCNTLPISIDVPYGYGIAQGALKGLLSIPNKPWTHMGLARASELEFNKTVLSAKNLAETNRKREPLKANRIRVV